MTKVKSKKRKKLKYLWLILPAIIIIAIISLTVYVSVKNSGYVYDPYGSDNMLSAGEKGTLILNYGGADGMPESETVEYTAYEEIKLPKLTKKGYYFVGWSCNGGYWDDTLILNSKSPKLARAFFAKDYSSVKSSAAVYTDEFVFTEFDEGEYPYVGLEAVDVYVDGGYKLLIYPEENFGGDETVVAYNGAFSGTVGSMKVRRVETNGIETGELTDDVKAKLLQTFAPRIWWAQGEEYFASTVENAAANMSRVMTDTGYIYMLPELDSPDYKCDYLYGSLTDCKAYAFAVEKEFKYLDLSYFVFTPYNKSKEVFGIEFGNHIGDWEHITVRLLTYEENEKIFVRPVVAEFSAHSFRNFYAWDDITLTDGTHPVIYTALGSHGMWKDQGSHVYVDAKIIKLTDECSQGTAWDLWKNNALETYSYDALTHTGTGIGSSEWNTCFDLSNYDENNNTVGAWGNKGWYPPVSIYPRLQGGPRGPQAKNVLNNYYLLNE